MSVNNRVMKRLNQFKYVLVIAGALAILTVIRAINPAIFRYDAVRWAEPSVEGRNEIAGDRLASMGKEMLIVMLDSTGQVPEAPGCEIMTADPHDMTLPGNIRRMRRNRGPVVLYSGDPSVSARVWMVLSEMGIKELFILKKDPA
jgi:hypothetical protein